MWQIGALNDHAYVRQGQPEFAPYVNSLAEARELIGYWLGDSNRLPR
jgi:hypothetical protein